MKSILDRSFKYVPAAKTNLAKTFKRERERLKRESERPSADIHELTPGRALLRKGGAT